MNAICLLHRDAKGVHTGFDCAWGEAQLRTLLPRSLKRPSLQRF
ncbi:hypothetical protein PK69_12385 [Xanthomonas phaseoli pv. phaseoli]|uniref:Uncharacterized protein n=1 Tax=Xanthomonas campestris pv. phaseoli TaxID=317013 RepID=A0AB38DVX9_XANCH|nr:hypothetical protein AC609_22580 [Xanthomonas phaseoli pv. phaseoli]AZU32567.1 hypothetical protein AC801_23275 [Xanthomonas sp. ISO98C4]AZU28149.1 hypothetical protein AC611_22605 [Xanthomonas phaseoli pv. phaseoli]AZU36914.1 hypothetical protein AC610_22575 [Xanthomonas phaseoli pv. phaseoli]KGT50194.1 hypothetical protein NZ02_15630 [Xanthomonas phaseoli pv. phaseoli]